MKPKIGITIDSFDPEVSDKGLFYSKHYWYAMRSHIVDAVIQCGGIPILMSHHTESVADYANLIDGLIISGGGFDVPPEYYNDTPHANFRPNYKRSTFERGITLSCIDQKKPILGICGGMQLLAALYGGRLYQAIEDLPQYHNHSQESPFHIPSHGIDYIEGSKTWELLGQPGHGVMVNSVHKQGVADAGRMRVFARSSEDQLIEGIEDPNHPFCIGVQWHPEYFCNPFDRQIFQSFMKVSSE
ncbi:MAG: gamma-glutamyl-gamma-aminobutyrate hydrolase family protein [Alphaproteobacteria bacterium]|nr:gamma-glutamyl-gamma-aminobutyrate hydrolase family protein [Alphaproteobacteria bacterium]